MGSSSEKARQLAELSRQSRAVSPWDEFAIAWCCKANALINRKLFPLFWHAKCWQWYLLVLRHFDRMPHRSTLRTKRCIPDPFQRVSSTVVGRHGPRSMWRRLFSSGQTTTKRKGRKSLDSRIFLKNHPEKKNTPWPTSSSYPLPRLLKPLKTVPTTGEQGFGAWGFHPRPQCWCQADVLIKDLFGLDVLVVPWLVSVSLPFSLSVTLYSASLSPSTLPLLS